MYTEQELKEFRRAIYEFSAEQLMWQVLYINAVAQHAPNLDIIYKRLLELPHVFQLIMLNTVDTPDVRALTQAVEEGNRLFIDYVDSFFHDGADMSSLLKQREENVDYIAQCMHKINPRWGITEWVTLINHQIALINQTMIDAKHGSYKTWAQILPLVCRLKMDMADYLAEGISSLN